MVPCIANLKRSPAFLQPGAPIYERMLDLTGGNRTVPVVFEEGKPIQVGWMGQGCFV